MSDNQYRKTVGDGERLIDTNGTLYIVGWDAGYFDITHVEPDPEEEDVYWTVGKYPTQSFTSENIDELMAAIEEGE